MQFNWDNNIAVILNANARKVRQTIIDRMRRFVPESQLYISKTLEEGQVLIREIMQKRFTHLVCGGGDGTLVEIINQVRRSLHELGGTDADMPKLGFLKLGTGNGWAHLLGSDNGKRSLPRMADSHNWKVTRFNLLESDQRLFHFAGMGWDAAVLNDYCLFKEKFGHGPLKKLVTGLHGYLTSMIFKTIPEQFLTRERPQIRVINRSPEVYQMRLGQPPRRVPIGLGETLYEGPVSVFGGSTTPYYGFKLVAFPFARAKEGFMNFRVISSSLWEVLSHWHAVFTGKWQSVDFRDWLVKDVSIEVDRPLPMQIGGDPCGKRDRWDLSISDLSVQVFDLTA